MKWVARLLGLGLAAALLLFGWGYWGATRSPQVVEASYRLPGLPPGTRVTVLLLSDTHHGLPDMSRARLDRIVAQANALKPDLILLAGDYHGGKLLDFASRPHMEPAVRPFAKLRAPLGVFAVMGNHDSPVWSPKVFAAQGSPRLLVNQAVDVGPLVVAGIDSVAHGAAIARTLEAIPPDRPVLLLLHEGHSLLYNSLKPRRMLALAGHTHGGQLILPILGNVGARMLDPPACLRGACTLNGWPIHVTSGVGTSWLPLRIGVPPEMVLLTLVPG